MAPTPHKPTVLLLEDEPIILMELCFAVEDLGGVPEGANTVEKALEILDTMPIDAAVLDLNLGRGQTCEPVRRRLDELDVPFVLHSGDLYRQGEMIQRMEVPVIPKPADSYEVARRALALVTRAAAE